MTPILQALKAAIMVVFQFRGIGGTSGGKAMTGKSSHTEALRPKVHISSLRSADPI